MAKEKEEEEKIKHTEEEEDEAVPIVEFSSCWRNKNVRFTLWLALLTFSAVSLGSIVNQVRNFSPVRGSRENTVIVLTAITLGIAAFVMGLHIVEEFAKKISDSTTEYVATFLVVGLWTAVISIVTSNGKNLAIDSSGEIINPNVFYFSWAALLTSGAIGLSCMFTRKTRVKEKLTKFLEGARDRIILWGFFTISSIVVMGVTSAIFKQQRGKVPTQDTKTKFIIAVGTVGTGVGILMMIILGKITTKKTLRHNESRLKAVMKFEGLMNLALLVLFACGVAYATNPLGPGGTSGNLYFFIWGAFITLVLILSSWWMSSEIMPKDIAAGVGGWGTHFKHMFVCPHCDAERGHSCIEHSRNRSEKPSKEEEV